MQRMTDLKYSEREELFDSVLPEYERALDGLWRPGQINYAWLCNEIVEHNGHGHMHVIPRYEFPVVFGGHEFKDEQWGHNYDPYPKRALPKKMLFRIRDALRTEIPLLVE
jgi:diadenosine tetraphosphate (Ap4A) HIT family hydrolase